jgi:uncharacterized protein YacL
MDEKMTDFQNVTSDLDNNGQVDSTSPNPDNSEMVDKKLYKKATRRAAFKIHLAIYVLVNLIFWLIWFFIIKSEPLDPTSIKILKTLIFFTIVWLLLLVGHYLAVYRWNKTLVEKELNKLLKENKANEEKLRIERQKKINSQQSN